jgi:predicted phosphodiesterase
MRRRDFIGVGLLTIARVCFEDGTLQAITPPQNKLAPFPALPKDRAGSGTVRFVALGDTGTGGPGQLAVASQLKVFHGQRPYDTALLLGDNLYPNGDVSGLVEKFEKPYEQLLSSGVRFHAVLGNHDVQSGRAAQINYAGFNMGGRTYYSFTRGAQLADFFALDSNQMDAQQLRWFEDSLSISKARWKIVLMHHPLYSSGKKHGSNAVLQGKLEPLFTRYGVAVVFAGHDHIYGRTAPIKGVQYFVSGAGGQLRRDGISENSQLFVAENDQVHSFMYVELKADRLDFWSVGEDGKVVDAGPINPPSAKERATTHYDSI